MFRAPTLFTIKPKSIIEFHIYRPHVVDSAGKETWADLHVDVDAGILEITVPQQFLNRAVYPVLVDPTLGYTTIGSNTEGFNDPTPDTVQIASAWTMPSDPGEQTPGNVYEIQFYTRKGSGAPDQTMENVIWADAAPGAQQKLSVNYVVSSETPQWYNPSMSGGAWSPSFSTTYLVGSHNITSGHRCVIYYDSTGGTGYKDQSSGGSFDKDVSNSWRISAYFNYYMTHTPALTDGLDFGDTPDPDVTANPTVVDGVTFSEGTRRGRVQKGVTTLVTDSANTYVDLDETVDTDHAVIFIDFRCADNSDNAKRPGNWIVRCQFASGGSQIQFIRNKRYTAMQVSWFVIECFNDEFTVQHGDATLPDTDSNVTDTITSVDTSKSIIICSANPRLDALTRQSLGFVTAKFNSGTEIQFDKGRNTDNGEDTRINWQVVEFDTSLGFSIQTGEKDCSGDISSGTTATISSVDTSRTLVHTQFRVGNTQLEGDYWVRTRLTGSTQLTFDKYTSNSVACYVRYWVIEWPTGVTVEHDTTAFTTETQKDVTVSQIDTERTFVDLNLNLDDSSVANAFNEGAWTSEIVDLTTVRHKRNSISGTPSGNLYTQTVDISGWLLSSPTSELDEGEAATDGIDFGDTPTVIATMGISAADGVDFGDTPTALATIDGNIADGVDFGDTPAVIASTFNIPAEDGVIFGDTPEPGAIKDDSTSDGVVFGDSTFSWIGFLDFAEDGLIFGDSNVIDYTMNPTAEDGVDFGDTPTVEGILVPSAADGVDFGEITDGIIGIDDVAYDYVEFGDTPIAATT
ncbi:MAG: hypothetical protein ACXABD_20200, partial [Candidatus Thorarchaeota archaeon]